jgi:hypothetical protein
MIPARQCRAQIPGREKAKDAYENTRRSLLTRQYPKDWKGEIKLFFYSEAPGMSRGPGQDSCREEVIQEECAAADPLPCFIN